jgi:hypothetical protein
MNTLRHCGIVLSWVAALIVGSGVIQPAAATDSPSASQSATPAASGNDPGEHEAPGESEDRADRDSDWTDHEEWSGGHRHRHGRDLINIGRDSDLPAGERADSVV